MDKIKNNKGIAYLKSGSKSSYVVLGILVVLGVIILVTVCKKIYNYYQKMKRSEKWLLNGTKSGKKRKMVVQDPNDDESITIYRSDNEEGGIEFSYSFWTYADDWSYKYGQWKHLFHKGNENSWPNRAPGVWLHPKENKMRVYMNTFNKIGEYVDIDNIPIGKWFHTIIAVKQKTLDIYINGNLKTTYNMSGLPKQNYGNIYINNFRGFSGYMSNIKYFNYYISYPVIDRILKAGPSMVPCVDTGESPPYLSANWWDTR